MAAITRPPGTRAFANVRTFWCATLTESGPLIAEINAASSLEISMLHFAGTGKSNAEVGRADGPRRDGASETEEGFTSVKNTIADIIIPEDPQADDTVAVNEARKVLQPWEEGYLVRFRGMSAEDPDASTAIVAGIRGTWQKVQLGIWIDGESEGGDGAELGIVIPISPRSGTRRFVLA